MAALTSNPKAVRPGKFLAEIKQIDAGVLAELPADFVFMINGTPQTAADIHAALRGWLGVIEAAEAARNVYYRAVSARVAITVAAKTYCKGLKAVVKQFFGIQSVALASFGIAVDKPIERTSQQHLVTAAKRTQTRAVRGTKGKRQLAAITVVGNPAIQVASDGSQQISPPPINVGHLGPRANAPTAKLSGPGNGTPTGGGGAPTK